MAFNNSQRFHVEGLRKQIDGLNRLQFVTALCQGGEIARQCRWVARNIEYGFGIEGCEVALDAFGAGARRVENYFAKPFFAPRQLCQCGGDRRDAPADIFDAIALGIEFAAIDRMAVAVDGDDFSGAPSDGEREISGAAVEFEHIVAVGEFAGAQKVMQDRAVAFRIDLGENVRLDGQAHVRFGGDADTGIAPDLTPAAARYDNSAQARAAVQQFADRCTVRRSQWFGGDGDEDQLVFSIAGDDLNFHDICRRLFNPTPDMLQRAVNLLRRDLAGVDLNEIVGE